jgi:Reverse transcriptase (RNA-dependent DNA polymerase)
VAAWLLREEAELLALQAELRSGEYRPGPYRFFEIYEPKRRQIAAAPFRDRVVHHALCQWLAPVLERRFIARSFSCQTGKGATAARDCCRRLTNRHRYVLKCDVQKFFPNVDHEILLARLAGCVRCRATLDLIRRILDSFVTGPEVAPPLFPADDLGKAAARPRGVPIGNLTSQLWGNFYLDALDHWITEQQRHGAFVRYTDDFLVFDDDKIHLWELRAGIVEQLARVRRRLAEPKSRLLIASEGVPFCGFRFLPGLRPRILGATKRRFERRRAKLGRARDFRRLTQTVLAWYQFSREGNSEGLRRAYATRLRSLRPNGRAMRAS